MKGSDRKKKQIPARPSPDGPKCRECNHLSTSHTQKKIYKMIYPFTGQEVELTSYNGCRECGCVTFVSNY